MGFEFVADESGVLKNIFVDMVTWNEELCLANRKIFIG